MEKIEKITLNPATNRDEAIVLVEQQQKWCDEYQVHSLQWIKGLKSAGRRARAISHNIVRNAATVNKAMTNSDKGEWN